MSTLTRIAVHDTDGLLMRRDGPRVTADDLVVVVDGGTYRLVQVDADGDGHARDTDLE